MTTFDSTQSNGLISVCIKKKTGYETALAESLGWTAIDARLYDAVKADGSKIEFKKQSGQQWFDLVKLAEFAEGNEDIEIYGLCMTVARFNRFTLAPMQS